MRCWKFFRSKVRIWTISHKKKLHVPDLNEGEKDIELERESGAKDSKRCKGVYCVDLGETFPTNIWLQRSASIQTRSSLVEFAAAEIDV